MKPLEWQAMVEIELDVIRDVPQMDVWNEIVLELPTQLPDMVSAVFYRTHANMTVEHVTQARRQAERVAAYMGDKSVLHMNVTAVKLHDDPLFTCAAASPSSKDAMRQDKL